MCLFGLAFYKILQNAFNLCLKFSVVNVSQLNEAILFHLGRIVVKPVKSEQSFNFVSFSVKQ